MNKAQEWREKSRALTASEADTVVDLALPSGMTIKARRPGPGFIAGLGRLPLSLATAAQEPEPVPIEEFGKKPAEDPAAFFTFLRDLLLYCVVDPEISLTPKAGQIHPREIADKDVNFIFHWAMRGSEAESLESFRRQPGDGSTGGDGAQVPPAPVGAVRHPGPPAGSKLRPGSLARPRSTR